MRALELVLAIYLSAAAHRPVRLPLADCATTDFLARKLSGLGIYLKDHLVFCDDEVTSMRDSGLMGLYD